MRNSDLNHILDECLTRIQSGKSTRDDCLREYSQHHDVLLPLLRTASEVRDFMTIPEPRPDYLPQSMARILNQVSASWSSSSVSRARPSPRILRPAFILASLVLVIVVLASGAGVVNVSAGSIPGDILYPVKRSYEEVRLTFATSGMADQDLLLDMADERLEEVEKALASGRMEDADAAVRGYEKVVARMLEVTGQIVDQDGPGSLAHVQERLQHHQQILMNVMMKGQNEGNEGLKNALDSSTHASDVIERVRQGESPSELAPGQLKKSDPDPESNSNDTTGQDKSGKDKTPKGKKGTPGPPATKTPRPTKDK